MPVNFNATFTETNDMDATFDAKVNIDGALPSDDLPLMDGEASPGIGKKFSRSDHRHPSDSTKANVADLSDVATSGSYNDLSDKPTIPDSLDDLTDDSTHRLVTDAEKAAWNAKYAKPDGGIPASDLDSDVQTSLGKADTALQTAPVNSVNGKTGAVNLGAADVNALPAGTRIPSKTSDLTNDSGFITASQVPSAPVQSVNSKTGAVILSASDVGAMPSSYVAPVTSVNGQTGDVVIQTGGGAVDSVNGKTGVVVLDAEDVGALPDDTPIPPTVTVDSALSDSSENPVQNKVVKEALDAKYSKPSDGIPTSDLNLVGLGTWLDNAGATIYTLSLSGTTVTLDESFLAVYYSLTGSARHTLFGLPIGGTEQQPIVLEMYLVHVDAQNYTITLACVYNGNRYSVTLSAASAITSPMTGTLVVETIVTVSDIPTAVSDLTNDSGFQTASQVQAAIAAIPSELPSVSSTDNSKFLRVVDGAWAAQAVPAAESASFGGA